MAAGKGRVDFSEPYPHANVGDTGFQLQVRSAVPRAAGYIAFVAIYNGKVEFTSDDVAITNPEGRNDFLDWIRTQLPEALETPEQRMAWWFACENVSANLSRAMEARQAEQTEPSSAAGGSQATRLVELAKDAELFHTPEGDAYATFVVGEHRETWQVKTKGFRRWLQRKYHETHQAAANSQAVQDALGVLEGRALFDGPEIAVATRLADFEGAVYLDLADVNWRVVRIAANGWQILNESPVRFRRSKGMLPLPAPVRDGNLADLRPFLNVASDGDWCLRVGWLVGALRPQGPYPVLVLHGEQGSAKSTAQKVLRRLIDPNIADLRAEPRDERDLFIAATNGWIVGFDNLSRLPAWLSDAICRIATGSGMGTREMYSDAEETLFAVCRPVLFNGIEELATHGDLLDRSIVQYQPVISGDQRRSEAAFWRDFDNARPGILGSLLDAVAVAMDRLPTTRLSSLPRMADFATWIVAAEPALGWETGTFLKQYESNREAANDLPLEASPIVQPLRKLLDKHAKWEGSATELLKELSRFADEATCQLKTWPRTGRTLSNALRRLTPNLRADGIAVSFPPKTKSMRPIHLEQSDNPSSPSSLASPGGGLNSNPGDQTGDDGDDGSPRDSAHRHPDQSHGDDGDDGDDGLHHLSESKPDDISELPF